MEKEFIMNKVILTDIDMSFLDMVSFILKWFFAGLCASLLIFVPVFAVFAVVWFGFLGMSF